MSSATVRVPAKINLCLGVGPVRDDGFHPLATVYQALDLYDEVRVVPRDDDEITVATHIDADDTSETNDVPTGDDNLAVRAARLLRADHPDVGGAELTIRKVIPVAGGMAGGSADAAAALLGCNEVWGLGLSKLDLERYAARLGSDVPFLLHGGNAVGSGRGETISPVLARGSYHWVLAVAPVGLATKDVYAEFDAIHAGRRILEPQVPDTLLSALRAGDPELLGPTLANDLTDAALSLRPELERTLDAGREADALGSILSGSGPTCLFLARDETHALDIAIALAGVGSTADVVQAIGPVAGARLI